MPGYLAPPRMTGTLQFMQKAPEVAIYRYRASRIVEDTFVYQPEHQLQEMPSSTPISPHCQVVIDVYSNVSDRPTYGSTSSATRSGSSLWITLSSNTVWSTKASSGSSSHC